MGDLWEQRLLPRVIDVTCSDKVTGTWRDQVCAPVAGEVLEVGFGSGTNLRHYGDAVQRVHAVEPSDLAWERAQPAIRAFGRPVERIGLDGAAIALADGTMDAVVSSYTMCTIPDLDSALAEMRRVLRPDGALHFVEHAKPPNPKVAARQDKLQPLWGRIAGGCHLGRDIPNLVADGGFTVHELDAFWMPGPRFMRPFSWMTVGRATPV
ncbi:class I SAM-dependent methyltransferase [Nocardioides marmoriginsengisoli]|uniref:Class I SAM-dependent methyltransferase n=1 Tax=Nocardioides marmoriginsengisoli TaxID=661483 RepID=A0A3N0CIV0_9ACTN|nr:class I SAM-dependent methyltransferase [Nocardioides marmoriginsengisoli]